MIVIPKLPQSETGWYASEDVANWLGVRHVDLLQSFNRMIEVWPELLDFGVKFDYSAPIKRGDPSPLLITGGAFAAFLYWREQNGDPEVFFVCKAVAKEAV